MLRIEVYTWSCYFLIWSSRAWFDSAGAKLSRCIMRYFDSGLYTYIYIYIPIHIDIHTYLLWGCSPLCVRPIYALHRDLEPSQLVTRHLQLDSDRLLNSRTPTLDPKPGQAEHLHLLNAPSLNSPHPRPSNFMQPSRIRSFCKLALEVPG